MAHKQFHSPSRHVLFTARRALVFLFIFWIISIIFLINSFSRSDKNEMFKVCPRRILTMSDIGTDLVENLWGYSTLWGMHRLNITSRQIFVPYKVQHYLEKYFKPLSLAGLDDIPSYCLPLLEGIRVIHPSDLPQENDDNIMVDFRLDPSGYPKPLIFSRLLLPVEFQYLEDLLLYAESLIRSGLKMMRRIRRSAEMVVGIWVSKCSSKPPHDFYISAMHTFRGIGRSLFVVVGDTKWAEENLNYPDVVFGTPGNPGFDLAVLSLCNHTILDFGDLAIWAGLRNEGSKYVYAVKPSLFNVLEGHGDWFIYIETLSATDAENISESNENYLIFTADHFGEEKR